MTDAKSASSTLDDSTRMALKAAGVGTWDFNPKTGELTWDAAAANFSDCQQDRQFRTKARSWPDFTQKIAPGPTRQCRRRSIRAGRDLPTSSIARVGIEDGIERWVAAAGRGILRTAKQCASSAQFWISPPAGSGTSI